LPAHGGEGILSPGIPPLPQCNSNLALVLEDLGQLEEARGLPRTDEKISGPSVP
jgi:hypothetical protein